MASRFFDGAEAMRRRVALGLARDHVGHLVGRGTESLVSYELGRNIPPTQVVLDLCDVLGCEPSDLLRPITTTTRRREALAVRPSTRPRQ